MLHWGKTLHPQNLKKSGEIFFKYFLSSESFSFYRLACWKKLVGGLGQLIETFFIRT
jgi:hypothetical protein